METFGLCHFLWKCLLLVMATRLIHVVAYWKHSIFICDGTWAWFFMYSFAVFHLPFEGADSSFSLWWFPGAGVFCLMVVLIPGVSCLSLPTPAPLSLVPLVEEFLSVSVWSGILKEISPEYSLEKLMVKLKMQYFGCRMRRTDSLHGDCNHESKRRLLLGRKVMTT